MNSIGQQIRNNLYEFYDKVCRIEGIYSERQDHWSVISNRPGTWPRIIYRIDPQVVETKSTNLLSGKISSGTYPEILIASDENIKEIDPILRHMGFYPFSAWKGMAAFKETATLLDLPESVQIVKLQSLEDIEQWIKIVSSELIAPARLGKTLLESLITQPEIEAFLLKYNGVGVSTILVFNSGSSTGFYLIATEKSAQRQGFAKMLVQQIKYQQILKSINPIILHATPKGEALYSKLGFLPYNQFFLYRLINTPL